MEQQSNLKKEGRESAALSSAASARPFAPAAPVAAAAAAAAASQPMQGRKREEEAQSQEGVQQPAKKKARRQLLTIQPRPAAAAPAAASSSSPPLRSFVDRIDLDSLSVCFSFLNMHDFLRAIAVCRQWRAARLKRSAWPALHLPTLLRALQDGNGSVSGSNRRQLVVKSARQVRGLLDNPSCLQMWRHMTDLKLQSDYGEKEDPPIRPLLERLGDFPCVLMLDLSECHLKSDTPAVDAICTALAPRLQALALPSDGFGDFKLSQFTSLRVLVTHASPDPRALSQLHQLVHLSVLSECTETTAAMRCLLRVIRWLSVHHQLRSLVLGEHWNIRFPPSLRALLEIPTKPAEAANGGTAAAAAAADLEREGEEEEEAGPVADEEEEEEDAMDSDSDHEAPVPFDMDLRPSDSEDEEDSFIASLHPPLDLQQPCGLTDLALTCIFSDFSVAAIRLNSSDASFLRFLPHLTRLKWTELERMKSQLLLPFHLEGDLPPLRQAELARLQEVQVSIDHRQGAFDLSMLRHLRACTQMRRFQVALQPESASYHQQTKRIPIALLRQLLTAWSGTIEEIRIKNELEIAYPQQQPTSAAAAASSSSSVGGSEEWSALAACQRLELLELPLQTDMPVGLLRTLSTLPRFFTLELHFGWNFPLGMHLPPTLLRWLAASSSWSHLHLRKLFGAAFEYERDEFDFDSHEPPGFDFLQEEVKGGLSEQLAELQMDVRTAQRIRLHTYNHGNDEFNIEEQAKREVFRVVKSQRTGKRQWWQEE